MLPSLIFTVLAPLLETVYVCISSLVFSSLLLKRLLFTGFHHVKLKVHTKFTSKIRLKYVCYYFHEVIL